MNIPTRPVMKILGIPRSKDILIVVTNQPKHWSVSDHNYRLVNCWAYEGYGGFPWMEDPQQLVGVFHGKFHLQMDDN